MWSEWGRRGGRTRECGLDLTLPFFLLPRALSPMMAVIPADSVTEPPSLTSPCSAHSAPAPEPKSFLERTHSLTFTRGKKNIRNELIMLLLSFLLHGILRMSGLRQAPSYEIESL